MIQNRGNYAIILKSWKYGFCFGTVPKVTDAGLKHLKELTNLKKLNINYTKITAAGLEHLNPDFPDKN